MNSKPSNPKDALGIRKAPMSTVSAAVLAEIGVAMLEGAAKYGRHNYRAVGVQSSVYYDATMRHLMDWWEGTDIDPDSGMHHITKAITSLVVLRDAMIQGMLTDDRAPRSAEFYGRLNELAGKILDRHADKAPKHFTIADTETPAASPFPYIGEDRRSGPREEGWVEWDGLGPAGWITHGLRVDVRLRNGRVYRNQPADQLAWVHRPPGDVDRHADIVAYRKVARLI